MEEPRTPSQDTDAQDRETAAALRFGVEETFRDYFLQYASYVITDRAIPELEDGLKPVQRRILYSLWENEDGRYNKVANLVGHCMKYHPHGDASIYAALVALGQKGLLIDTQGNWGDPVTGDPPAAARYIEARLTPFAKEVLFAPQLTRYKLSYDGRNREPVALPVRFPLLLALGAEGIAVGLTTRILPHNFVELLEAQKAHLRGETFELYPDFPTGGLMDVRDYQDGRPGSRVRVRAVIEQGPGKSLVIREIPFGTTTQSLIDSIIRAGERGKIKLANIQDNTSAHVEVVVNFQRGVDLEKAKAALYAFTDCEVSLAANGMVIRDGQPANLSVSEMLEANTEHMVELLRRDLEIQLNNLEEDWHRKSLVQIFIENRIYLRLEECKTWEAVIAAVDEGLRPHVGKLRRPVTQEDLVYLTEVKMRRISAWDAERARKELAKVDALIRQVKRDLADIVGTTVRYIDSLIERYGAGRERRTRIVSFDSVEAAAVAERTRKLYVEPKAGFIGTDLREAQEVGPCSDLDDVLVVFRDGNLVVVRVTDKKYVGEDIVYTEILDPTDREAVYNVIYTDEDSGKTYAKRFTLGGYTRERSYSLGAGQRRRVLFFARGESGVCAHLRLRKKPRVKPDRYVRFDELRVKGRSAAGNVVTRHAVSSARSLTEATVARRLAETSSESESPDPEQTPSGGSSLRQSTLF